ncbi:MAG: hypothetical protein E6G63_02505 [Actinobacteria bacterium]|nr:MAG: hypothetical protein E6G63_02505 [Actinomycetota bacterium]
MSVERLSRMTDEELGEALRVLEPLLLQPEPPDVAGEVRAAIRAGRRPRRRLSSRARIVILIAAAVLAVATAAAAAKLVIDLGGIRIEREPTLTATPTGSPIAGVALGQPISLTEATTAAGFTPVVPRGLGTPDRVWLTSGTHAFGQPDTVLVAMAWRSRPGLPRIPGTPFGASLIQISGDVDVLVKHVQAPFHRVREADAFWIDAPHEVELLTPDGTRVFPVTANVLLWQRGTLAFRLETDLSLRRALRLAGLTRP